jgi:Tol biopolymer transport system component
LRLTPGSRLGSYEVIAAVGAGGMGEVYRARDTALGRDVAIKIVPPVFSADPDRRARFEREAQMLAALNHTNIGAIYGLVDTEAGKGLVLEFVEGPTLADLIAGQRVPDPFAIARQIADALDAAHEKGIVHRDLKPANVKVTPGGHVKVLDFGLAKAVAATASGDSQESPTITSPAALTRHGVVLGTAAYMSPEQARGREVDKRADIWAFGCVLYELVSGRRPFDGETTADVISAILSHEPDWTVLSGAPPAVQRLVRRCLEKDPRRRLRDIADARIELEDPVPASGVTSPLAVRESRPRRAFLATAIVAVVALAAAATAWIWTGAAPAAPIQPIRFQVPMPEGIRLPLTVETLTIAVAPDGSQIAFIGLEPGEASQVWVKSLGDAVPRALGGTDGASSVFWSPDARSIAFFAEGRLKRMDLGATTAVPVCDVPTGVGLVGSWGSRGLALFASVEGQAIYQVSMAGGTPVEVAKPDRAAGEIRTTWPSYLPDGERFLYQSQTEDVRGRVFLAVPGEAPRLVIEAASNAQYVEPGYVLFARDSALFALPFDAGTGRVTGDPFATGESVDYMFGPNWALFSASHTGVLAWHAAGDRNELKWVNQAGDQVGTVGNAGDMLRMRISFDGRRALFDRKQPGNGAYDLWLVDLDRGVEQRLTSGAVPEGGGTWLPDGRSAFLGVANGAPPRIYRKDLAGGSSGAMTPVLPQRGLQEPTDVDRAGKFLLFSERMPAGEFDLFALPLSENAEPFAVVSAPMNQNDGKFSPDGQHIAYVSAESGYPEIYVASFPKGETRTRVSVRGGRSPRWSRDGRQLFYISGSEQLMTVPVVLGETVQIGAARLMFPSKPVVNWRTYDVAPDGRFLAMITTSVGAAQPLSVTTNWLASRR